MFSLFLHLTHPIPEQMKTKDEVYYVARHPKNHSTELEHHEIDHAIGFLDSDGLGKIYVIASSKELSYESGELLRVIEPARYELSDIKLLSLTARISYERIALGSTILKNEGSEEADVSATIGFDYKVVRNFGNHDGVARSVNTTAFITKNEKFEFFWGIERDQQVVESKSVSTRLLPGTAINVTIWGNYSTSEGPYKAYIVTYFTDGTKTKKRQEQFTAVSGQQVNKRNERFTIPLISIQIFILSSHSHSISSWRRVSAVNSTLNTATRTGCTTTPSFQRRPSARSAHPPRACTSPSFRHRWKVSRSKRSVPASRHRSSPMRNLTMRLIRAQRRSSAKSPSLC